MIPIKTVHCNKVYGPPEGMDESQVHTIHTHEKEIVGGNIDGSLIVTTAWQLTTEDVERLNANGGVVYASFVGGLPPHRLVTSMQEVWVDIDKFNHPPGEPFCECEQPRAYESRPHECVTCGRYIQP
jgi:hypothetical protein